MRTVIQRVSEASVTVEGEVVGRIGRGALLLVGIEKGDTEAEVESTARKIAHLRFFPGKTPMDRTLQEVDGACLVVSQFTLHGSLRKGNRPGFDRAEDPVAAEALYVRLCDRLRAYGLPVETGRFGAWMDVQLRNDGPVTFVLEVRDGRVADL